MYVRHRLARIHGARSFAHSLTSGCARAALFVAGERIGPGSKLSSVASAGAGGDAII